LTQIWSLETLGVKLPKKKDPVEREKKYIAGRKMNEENGRRR
jgi:hypothetical protein